MKPVREKNNGNMNLRESIKRILKKEINESIFFRRRINLDKVESLLPIDADQTYYETKSYEQFKYELTLKAVESIMWSEYGLNYDELPEQEEIEFVTQISDIFNQTIRKLYNELTRTIK